MIKEVTKAKVEFHERYWKNVSKEGEQRSPCALESRLDATFWPRAAKDFILTLIKADASERPTATQALHDKWLTEHEPSKEHDLSGGLKDNWCRPVRKCAQGPFADGRMQGCPTTLEDDNQDHPGDESAAIVRFFHF